MKKTKEQRAVEESHRVMDDAMTDAIFEDKPLQFGEVIARCDDFTIVGGTLKVWTMDAWNAQTEPTAIALLDDMDTAGGMIRRFIAEGRLA